MLFIGWPAWAEFRDVETGDHILRMSPLFGMFGPRQLGLPRPMCETDLKYTSPLHDIGKVATLIPSA